MPHDWDDAAKRLVYASPQDFVSWLMKDAIFKRMIATELKNKTFKADIVMEIELNGKDTILATEFQSTADDDMPKRLQRYNILVEELHESKELQKNKEGKPKKEIDVWSVVIYMRKCGEPPQSPYIKRLANG